MRKYTPKDMRPNIIAGVAALMLAATVATAQERQTPQQRAQERLDQLSERVETAKAKLAEAQKIGQEGDSIVAAAQATLDEAKAARKEKAKDFERQKAELKDYLKSKDAAVRKEAEAKYKELTKAETTALKDADREIANAQKEVNRGKSVIAKGKARQKPAEASVKAAQKKLDEEKKRLEANE